MGQRRLKAHMGRGVQDRRDDEWVRVRFSKLRREQEKPWPEPDDLARGDGSMCEHFPGRFRPVGENIPDDCFIEDAPWGREAEDKLSHGLHRAIRLHYS